MSSFSDQELYEINEVFVSISRDNTLPLKRGLVLRQIMWDMINQGKTPNDYRYMWVNAAALNVVKYIGQMAGEFDRKHPGDRASVDDLKDILNHAIKLLDKKR